ncbi:MAG: hypothetical protein ACW7DV_12710, partial [Paraglaciecola chathamensis]
YINSPAATEKLISLNSSLSRLETDNCWAQSNGKMVSESTKKRGDNITARQSGILRKTNKSYQFMY